MKRTFVFKLYRSRKNKYLHALIDIASNMYNHLLALQKTFYRIHKKYISLYRLQKHLTKLKRQERFSKWTILGSQAAQNITERLDKGYQRFFDSQKTKEKRRITPPKFKSRKKYRSITLKQAGYKLLGENRIRIGKYVYRFHKSRDIEGEIKTLTIKRDSLGELYLCFSCEMEKSAKSEFMTGQSAGFDFGLITFFASSDEEKYEAPLFFKSQRKALKKAHRSLSTKKKGSRRREQARLVLARIYRKIDRQRREFHFKLARQLAQRYDALYFEDLDLDAMKKRFGRKISDLGFHQFLQILKGYVEQYGKIVHCIDRYYPSSKVCHHCLKEHKDLSLKERFWTCPYCHMHHDRDINAAKNIKRVGASTLGLGDVRPAMQAITV